MILNSFLLLIALQNALSIQINYIKVPSAVKNNSDVPIILDCNYSLRPDDTELVLKWFLNEEVVYQWIPPQKPQSLGLLKNRVDLKYKATDDPKTVYRAMKIKNPTHEIAGEYKCFVSTFADEDFSVKNMIVFEPEKALIVSKSESEEAFINFTCLAVEVYPTPKLLMYKERDDFFNKNRLLNIHWDITKHPNGRFTVFVVATSPVEAIEPGNLIHCEMRIPGTGYTKIKSLLYYPEAIRNFQVSTSSCFSFWVLFTVIISNICF